MHRWTDVFLAGPSACLHNLAIRLSCNDWNAFGPKVGFGFYLVTNPIWFQLFLLLRKFQLELCISVWQRTGRFSHSQGILQMCGASVVKTVGFLVGWRGKQTGSHLSFDVDWSGNYIHVFCNLVFKALLFRSHHSRTRPMNILFWTNEALFLVWPTFPRFQPQCKHFQKVPALQQGQVSGSTSIYIYELRLSVLPFWTF